MLSHWPVDENGNPLAIVSMSASEKIGLPQYSNVDIGPATVMRCVIDTPEARAEGLKECTREVERIIAVERVAVLNMIGHTVSNP